MIFSVEIFAQLQKRLEELFGLSAAHAILYAGGNACGISSARRLREQSKLECDLLLDAFLKLKKKECWGEMEFRPSNPGDLMVIVKGSFEARGYGKFEKPVCWFLLGYLDGALTTIMKREVKLVEVACITQGEPYCIFKSRVQQPPLRGEVQIHNSTIEVLNA